MNNYFKTYFDAKNAVLPLWGGMKYTSQTAGETKRTVSEATDYISMLNDALEKAAILCISKYCQWNTFLKAST